MAEGGPLVDFEVAKVSRILGRRKSDVQVIVTRRGRTITVLAARLGGGSDEGARAPVAQLRGESEGRFALYWSRATGGWEAYGVTGTLDECIEEVRRDAYGCFWGP